MLKILLLLQLHGKFPQGQVEMATVCGFHTHIGEVVGLQSFFVFYRPGGRVSAVCSAGITIQREVRESSDGAPLLQIKHIPHSRWFQSLTIVTAGWLLYASSHWLVMSLTSSADAAFHFYSLWRMSSSCTGLVFVNFIGNCFVIELSFKAFQGFFKISLYHLLAIV